MTFDSFWELYPKRVAKKDARKAWDKLKVTDELFLLIEQDIKQRIDMGLWDDYQYVPYPATYLNAERWDDELPPPKQSVIEKWTDRSWSEPSNVRKIK
jgi:hypothetical protein